MAILVYRELVFFLLLVFFVNVKCKDSGLSDFTKKVKSMLPTETLKKVFSVQRDNPDQFVQAIRNGVDKLGELFGTPLPDTIAEKLIKNGEDYKNKAATHLLFRVLVNSEGDTLKDYGVLNSKNVEEMAKALTKNLEDAAMSLKSENVQETYPAIITANVKLLKTFNLSSPNVQRKLANNIDLEVQILTSENKQD